MVIKVYTNKPFPPGKIYKSERCWHYISPGCEMSFKDLTELVTFFSGKIEKGLTGLVNSGKV